MSRKNNIISRKRQILIKMSETKPNSEFYGLDLSDFAAVPLKGTPLAKKDKPKYTPASSHLISYALQHSQPVPSLKNAKKTQKKNALDKRKLNKHKVLSPEEVTMKCARQAYERELAANMQEKEAVVKKPSPFFERKKKNQQKRRLERLILIKAYKWQLYETYGRQVFKKRWQIGRAELIQTLSLVPENIDYQYLTQFITDRRKVCPAKAYVSDHRMVRFIYNNPFLTLMRKNVVEYERKVINREKERSRKIECDLYKRKARGAMRRERLFEEPRERVSTMALAKKAKATIYEDRLLKRIELDETQDNCDAIDTVDLDKEFPSLLTNL